MNMWMVGFLAWIVISIPVSLLVGRMLAGANVEPDWGTDDDRQAALQAGLDELERYANTGDPLYAEAARSLFLLAGFELAHDLEIDGEVQR